MTHQLLPLRMVLLGIIATMAVGCASADSVPRELHEDPSWNYQRIFHEPIPPDVTVVHSIVVTYADRFFVVTTDDYEFELLAPHQRMSAFMRRFYLRPWSAEPDGFFAQQLRSRKENAKPWYAPKPLDQYETYRDSTTAGYNHMLIDKQPEPDERRRIFISKH